MDPATLATSQQRLLDQQDQLVQRRFELEDDLQRVTGREIEYGDRAQAEAPEEALEHLDEQSRREWEAIQAALACIEAGPYGDCDMCGEPISPARLDAMPMAPHCMRCQEKVEKARRSQPWTSQRNSIPSQCSPPLISPW